MLKPAAGAEQVAMGAQEVVTNLKMGRQPGTVKKTGLRIRILGSDSQLAMGEALSIPGPQFCFST